MMQAPRNPMMSTTVRQFLARPCCSLSVAQTPLSARAQSSFRLRCSSPFGVYHSFSSKSVEAATHDVGGRRSEFGSLRSALSSSSNHPSGITPTLSDLATTPKEEPIQHWEQNCHATLALLASKGYFTTDEFRYTIEGLSPDQYRSWTYYERWTAAMITLLLQSKVIDHDALHQAYYGTRLDEEKVAKYGSLDQPKFAPGDTIRVKSFQDGVEWRRPHIRTPGYVYGVRGVIEDVLGTFGDPSLIALGLKEPPSTHLYRISVNMADLWPEQSTSNDSVALDVYEHWLEASKEGHGHDFEDVSLLNHNEGEDCVHHHHHAHGADNHEHEPRPLVEQRAIDREGSAGPGQELFAAFLQLLTKGSEPIITPKELRRMSEALDSAGKTLKGATIVTRAWVDPHFREWLLKNPAEAASEELGIVTANPNAPTVLTVVANSPQVHNLVVCTLCSCYPSSLLGIAPSWYKSTEFRSRAVREPRQLLQEDFGTVLNPLTKSIRVHDSTAEHRYLVLPERPAGTEGWTEEELRRLVTRDSMIGVTVPTVATN